MEFMTHFQIVKQSKLQSFVGGKIQKSYLLVSFHFILPPSASASKHQLINSCMRIKLWPACDFKVIESLSCATATKGSYKLLLIGASKKKNCLSTKTEIEEEQSNTIQSVDRLEQRQTIYTNQTRRKTSWKTQIKCTNTTNQKLNEKPDWNQMEMEINQSVFCINVCMSHGVAQPLSRSLCVVVHYIHLCKTMFTSWRLLRREGITTTTTTYSLRILWCIYEFNNPDLPLLRADFGISYTEKFAHTFARYVEVFFLLLLLPANASKCISPNMFHGRNRTKKTKF